MFLKEKKLVILEKLVILDILIKQNYITIEYFGKMLIRINFFANILIFLIKFLINPFK